MTTTTRQHLTGYGILHDPSLNKGTASSKRSGTPMRVANCIFENALAGVPGRDDVGAFTHARAYKPAYPE